MRPPHSRFGFPAMAGTLLGLALGSTAPHAGGPADPVHLPLYFVENRGQLDRQVDFTLEGSDRTIYFTADGVTFSFVSASPRDRRWVLKLDFLDARGGVRPLGLDRTPAIFSYFTGAPEAWHTGLSTFSGISYGELWPGVDLVYSASLDRLKQTFIVRPGADPRRIGLAFRGASRVNLTADGELDVRIPLVGFRDEKPYA